MWSLLSEIDPNSGPVLLTLEIFEGEANHLMRVHLHQLQPEGFVRDMSEVEQLIDQAHETLNVAADECKGGLIEQRWQFRLVVRAGGIVTHLEQVDHGRNGGERIAQLVEKHSVRFIFCFDCELKCMGVALGRRLKFSPGGDIADVALDHFGWADKVDITDKLHLDLFASLRPERQIFVTDVLLRLQLFEGGLVRCDVFEQADLPELEADYAFERIVEQIEQKWIHIDDLAAVGVEDREAVLRGSE